MTSEDMEEVLKDAIYFSPPGDDVSVKSFKDAGILANHRGLVVRIGREEFRVTIVRSR